VSEVAEVVRALPALVWTVAAVAFVVLLRQPIAQALYRLERFEGFGVKLALRAFSEALEARPGERNGQSALAARAALTQDPNRFRGAEILWVDDEPSGNRLEIRLFGSLGAHITCAVSSAEAERALARVGGVYPAFHLIISDITRRGTAEGLSFLQSLLERDSPVPLIFYVGAAQQPKPLGSFGIADNPAELVQLVFDALRSRQI
jgi:CheY-like chemotaxis protein